MPVRDYRSRGEWLHNYGADTRKARTQKNMTRKTKSTRQKTPRPAVDKLQAASHPLKAEPGREEEPCPAPEVTPPLPSGQDSPVLQPVLPQAVQVGPLEAKKSTEEKIMVPEEAQNRAGQAHPMPMSPPAESSPNSVSQAPADGLSLGEGLGGAIAKVRSIEWQLRGPNSPDQAARQMEELNGVLEAILSHLGTQAAQFQAQEARLSDLHRQLSDLEGSVNSSRTAR